MNEIKFQIHLFKSWLREFFFKLKGINRDFHCQCLEEFEDKCKYQCDHCKEYYKPLEEMKDKQQTINSIEQIIKDEHRKCNDVLDWKRLAAIKIYRMLFEDCEDSDVDKYWMKGMTQKEVEDYLKNL